MIKWKDLKDPEFWEDKKKYFKQLNKFLISYFKWFVVLLVIIVLGTGFIFLIQPKYKEINSLLKSSKQKQQKVINQKKQNIRKKRRIIASYNKITSRQKKKVEAVISPREHKEELFTELRNLVEKDNKNNLILKSVSLGSTQKGKKNNRKVTVREENKKSKNNDQKEQDNLSGNRSTLKGVEKVQVRMFVFGTDYNSLKDLLKKLERNLPIMNIVQVSFGSGGNSVNLVLETYQLK